MKNDLNARIKGDGNEVGIETKYRAYLLQNKAKKAMIITSRVHPGETQSSYALEGMVDFLLSDAIEARQLREQYIIYVVPMINPDGVIHGNHRTDLAGFDMNRRWMEASPYIHP
jgi:murein tripeptide amidase MpaA